MLGREKAEIVKEFFQRIPPSKIFSDFSLHSIGIFLLNAKMPEVLSNFIYDIINAGIQIVVLDSHEIIDLIKIANEFNLDFDDAYQYKVAEKYYLQIVSFDQDFDRT